MPELPEVQSVVATLRPALLHRRLERVLHLRPDVLDPPGFDLAAALAGRRVDRLERRAKRIVFQLDTAERFFIHLGMTGRLLVADADDPLPPHAHLLVSIEGGRQLRFIDPRRFGGIFWMGRAARHLGLGPEPLSLRPDRLAAALAGTARAVKTALLDQSLIAGIGNIYADESLHRAMIHPTRRACDLTRDEVRRLNRAIKLTLRRAIAAGGSSIRDYVNGVGERGSFQQSHRVYDRTGQPCPCCRTPIDRIVLGGRSTHFCPRCQPR
jgi:formamidopyrimidine-DNA glycosylase